MGDETSALAELMAAEVLAAWNLAAMNGHLIHRSNEVLNSARHTARMHEDEVTALRTQLDEAVRLLRNPQGFTEHRYTYVADKVDAFLATINKEAGT